MWELDELSGTMARREVIGREIFSRGINGVESAGEEVEGLWEEIGEVMSGIEVVLKGIQVGSFVKGPAAEEGVGGGPA